MTHSSEPLEHLARIGTQALAANLQSDRRRYDSVSDLVKPHNAVAVPGQKLEDYTSRTADDEGKYVHVVQHKEWFEEIPQPPTPEEIEQRKKEERTMAAIVAGSVVALFGFLGAMAYTDSRARRKADQKNN